MLFRVNKFAKIILCWAGLTAGSIYTFYSSKKSIDQKRYENMKIRERMSQANVGEYNPSYRKF